MPPPERSIPRVSSVGPSDRAMSRPTPPSLLCLTLLLAATPVGALAAGGPGPVGLIRETGPDGRTMDRVLPEGARTLQFISGSRVIAQRTFFPGRALDVIVQFKDAPI